MRRKYTDIPTSTTLLELCRKNDPGAWDRLEKVFKKLVLTWLKEYDVPAADCEKVFQDVWTSLSGQFKKFRVGLPGKFRNWLRTITHSAAVDYLKNNKKGSKTKSPKGESKILDPDFDASLITTAQEIKERAFVNRQIMTLIKDCFNPVHLKAFELVSVKGMSSMAAAEQLHLTPDNIRQINCRIRKRIREEFDGLL